MFENKAAKVDLYIQFMCVLFIFLVVWFGFLGEIREGRFRPFFLLCRLSLLCPLSD